MNLASKDTVQRTWEPTARLRWAKAKGSALDRFPSVYWSGTGDPMQLQQLWRSLETHEAEWRAIEIES